MKSSFVTSVLLLCLTLTSCVVSVNPLITGRNIDSFRASVGTWKDEHGSVYKVEPLIGSSAEKEMFQPIGKDGETANEGLSKMSATEKRLSQNVQVVTFVDDGQSYTMLLYFRKLGEHWFAQLSWLPGSAELNKAITDSWYTFYKVEYTGSELRLLPMDPDYLQQLMNRGRLGLPYEQEKSFESSWLTASPEQLELFLKKYAGDKRLFHKRYSLVLKRA